MSNKWRNFHDLRRNMYALCFTKLLLYQWTMKPLLVASLEFKWNLGWPLLWPCPPCRPDQESRHSLPTASSYYWSRSAWSPQPRLRPCTGVQRTERDNHTLPLHCIQHTLPRIRKCQLSHLLLFVIISKGRKCNLQSIPGIIFDAVSCILGSNYVLISKG